MYIGGMLNFITAETYWVKIAALAAVLLMERRRALSGLQLVPWGLLRVSDLGRVRAVSRALLFKVRDKGGKGV
jgi:hypothetical protein